MYAIGGANAELTYVGRSHVCSVLRAYRGFGGFICRADLFLATNVLYEVHF